MTWFLNSFGWTGGSSGGGTVTGADNGLNLNGTIVELGGNLIHPTTLNALASNTLSINDQSGLFMQTRDALGNFFFNNIGGTGTLIGTSQYIFSYLGDGGNVFEDTLIVINFGGANSIKGGSDFWNFGDYTIAEDNYSIFNFGRFNEYYNSSTVFLNGYYNTLNAVINTNVVGTSNVFSDLSDSIILGFTNIINQSSQIGVFGYNNTIASINNATIIGFGNGNALSDEILIAQNDLGIRVDINGNVGIGVPYAPVGFNSINARLHVSGVDVNSINQRLEPVLGVYEDTTGATIPTTDDIATPLETIPIPIDTIVMIESYITCRKTAGGGVGVIGAGNGYIRTVKAQNIGGVVTIGIIQSSFTSDSIPSFNATFAVSGTDIVINVNGDLNDDVTWNSITKKYRVG